MSWKSLPNGTEVDLAGPVGDTLEVTLSSTSTDYAWNGWTWSGQVRETPDAAATVGTFSFSDSSTSTALALTATVGAATTATWNAGDTLVYGIQGTKGGRVVTFVTGRVVPVAAVVR
jgi:hypothetical protein